MSQVSRLCVRAVEFTPTETREGSDGRTLEGYGAVFGQPANINSWEGRFTETVAPGAFTKTLSERKPIMQFNHGRDVRTGSVPIGAIQELREDNQGLYVKARLFDNPVVEPIRQAIEGGAISGMSFSFNVVRDEWRDGAGQQLGPNELSRLLHEPGERGPLQRTLKEVQLHEVGPVVSPAYPQTSVGVRSLTDEEREELLAEYRRTMVEPEESAADVERTFDEGEKHVTEEPAETILREADATSDEEVREGVTAPEEPAVVTEAATDTAGERKTPPPEPAEAPAGYADAQKHLPIGSAEECQHSWARLHHDKTLEDSYVSHERAVIKTRIKAAAEKLGIKLHKDPLPDAWKNFNGGQFVKSAEPTGDGRAMGMDGPSGGDAVPVTPGKPEKKKHVFEDGNCTACGY